MRQRVANGTVPRRQSGRSLAWLTGFVLLVGTGGCLSLPQEPRKDTLFDRDGIDAILAASDRRVMIIKDHASTERVCLAPGPDYSVTSSRGVDVGMGGGLPVGPKQTEHFGGDVSRGALSLGGRNPGVLIARELMYRACELSMNLNADAATTIKIYIRSLEPIEKIAPSETGSGSASVAAMPADARLQPPPVSAPGQPTSPGGFPSDSFGIPSTPPAQPGGPGGFPADNTGIPGTPPAQPGGPGGFPADNTGIPGTPPAQPGGPGGFPANNAGIPGTPPAQPGGASAPTP